MLQHTDGTSKTKVIFLNNLAALSANTYAMQNLACLQLFQKMF